MDQAACDLAVERRVDRLSAGDVARALHVIIAGIERSHEGVDRLDPVLAVAVDGDDALIALIQRPGVASAELRAEPSRSRLDQQRAAAGGAQRIQRERA